MELLATFALAAALAAGPGPEEPSPEAVQAVLADTDHMTLRSFDQRTRQSNELPNERYRLYAAQSAVNGNWGDALRQFRKAARYADKYSQHRLSLMYWHGVGVERDPATAYAWADLAAERAYPTFVILREKMWLELDDAQRERAQGIGVALYAEYGDKVAKPRLADAMLHTRTRMTGSRTGYDDGRLQVYAPSVGPGGMGGDADQVEMSAIYASWRLNPKHYWAVEDAIWKHGNVEVGPATKTDADD
ncbi:hypothetical protein [Lysobacter panacisoli]|uniref:Sel1 repeat family protein n=1 Tax=Lysobacter panacisoli TaxID=1255263 RepID=A0ABP9KYA1_9GAMM|nr:hypothetical protein [Lysobacter panacisoli]